MLKKDKYLVAIDLDGTLLRDDKTISNESIKFLQNFEKNGNYVVISSGRAPRSILKYQEIINLNSPFVAYNGAFSRCKINKELNFDYKIENEFAKKFYKDQINKTIELMMCEADTNMYFDILNDELIKFFEPMDMNIITGNILNTLNEDVYSCIVKIKEPMDQNRKLLSEYFKQFDNYEIRFWSKSVFAEVYIKGVSKGHSLEKIVNFEEVLPQNVLVFGDAENDLEMLNMFENSFLMCNGLDELKEQVKHITKKDNNHDGVIFEIENFINN